MSVVVSNGEPSLKIVRRGCPGSTFRSSSDIESMHSLSEDYDRDADSLMKGARSGVSDIVLMTCSTRTIQILNAAVS